MKYFVLLALAPLSVAASECAPGMGVQFPFRTEAARANFAQCLGVNSPPAEKLKRIESICYVAEPALSGCQPGSTDCESGDTHFRGVRSLAIGVHDEIAPSAVKKHLESKQRDGCDKFLLRAFTWNIGHRSAAFDFTYAIKDRACDDFFGTMDICEGSVSARYEASLSDKLDFAAKSFKTGSTGRCLKVIPYEAVPHAVGLLLSSLAPVGQMLKSKLAFGADWSAMPGKSLEGPANTKLPNTQLTSMDYTPDYSGSGFREVDFENGERRYVLEYSESGYLDGVLRNIYIRERKREIKFLERLGRTSAEVIEVAKGDSLTRIAQNFYGDPQLFLVLDKVNRLDGRKIREGEKLIVPQPHQICDLFLNNSSMVRHGQSVWSKTKSGEVAPGVSESDVYSGNLDLIYPYEILQDVQIRQDLLP